MEIISSAPDDLTRVVEWIDDLRGKGFSIFLLTGDLGAGKTTLVRALCESWGVAESVSSPTFSIVNAYASPVNGMIYHMDLYRLEKPEDLEHIGLDDYLSSGAICLIEWPDLARPYLTGAVVEIKVSVENQDIRTFRITTHDAVDA